MNTQDILNKALVGLDQVGYKLEELGITDKVNRHTTLAFVMAEQNHIRGELDSLNAKLAQQKVRIERTKRRAEALLDAGLQITSYPLQIARSLLNMPAK